jgi:hypothetical protein
MFGYLMSAFVVADGIIEINVFPTPPCCRPMHGITAVTDIKPDFPRSTRRCKIEAMVDK